MNPMNKKIKDMTKEERAAYQREWYKSNKQKRDSGTLHLEIHNCPEDLRLAILAAIKESK